MKAGRLVRLLEQSEKLEAIKLSRLRAEMEEQAAVQRQAAEMLNGNNVASPLLAKAIHARMKDGAKAQYALAEDIERQAAALTAAKAKLNSAHDLKANASMVLARREEDKTLEALVEQLLKAGKSQGH
jgi:hypothetical protein